MIPVLMLLLSSVSAVVPQCSWTPRYSGQFRTTAFDVAVDGGYLWVATGYGVQLLRRSDLTVLDAAAIPGSTRRVVPNRNGFAYAASGSRLYVLSRAGDRIEIVRHTDAGATINELLLHDTAHLYVGTSSGAAHYQFLSPDTPTRSSSVFATSRENVTGLASRGDILYAADGDASVEIFNIAIASLPQKTGTLDSIFGTTAVHATSDNYVFTSDRFGQNTDVFSGTSRLARLPIGASAFAASPSRVHFLAGPDRTLRAVDFNVLAQPTELFEYALPASDGSDNVIHAIDRADHAVYVAAGDIGLVVFDASPIARPYPLVGYTSGATTSTVAHGAVAWTSSADGTLTEYAFDPSGIALTKTRTWAGGAAALVHDADGQRLLTSSGATATLWSLAGQPAPNVTATFAIDVTAAVMRNDAIVALLQDGSVWTAAGGTTQKAAVPRISAIARNGSTIALMEILLEGKTRIHLYANGDLTTVPQTITLDGAAVGNLALGAARAAVFLFNGVNVIDLASGTATPIAGSTGVDPRQLAIAGDDVLVLSDRTLFVYEDGVALTYAHPLPANAVALGATTSYAVIASADGVIVTSYLDELPTASMLTGNSFYTKMLAAGDRLHLLTRDGVEQFALRGAAAPQFAGVIRSGNLVDFTATTNRVYTLSGNSQITAHSLPGAIVAQTSINEGIDTKPLSITTAGGAVWVSIARGCLAGACEQKTFVLDPNTLAVTATMTGEAVDVAVAGNTAYVLTDLPDEIRSVNLTNPQQPAITASIDAPASARSIAVSGTSVYVLGDVVYAYGAPSLAAAGTHLTPVNPTAAHQIRTAGECVLVSGRGATPEVYALPAFTPATAIDVPSHARAFAASPDRIVVLTDHSIEVWSSAPAEPSKRRAVR